MTLYFLRGGGDQRFLLGPDRRDWLPTGHLAWFSLDVVERVDRDRSPGGVGRLAATAATYPSSSPTPAAGRF
jgi:hypothetical protein